MGINGNHHLFKDIPYIHNVFLITFILKRDLKKGLFFCF